MDHSRLSSSRFRKTDTRASGASKPLMRDAYGKLRPDDGDHEIGDVWAEQRRIQLAESILEDKRQAALRRLRRERGLVGLARLRARRLVRTIRRELFGTESLQPKAKAASDKTAQPAVLKFGRSTSQVTRRLADKRLGRQLKRRPVQAALILTALVLAAGLLLLVRPDSGRPEAGRPAASKPAAAALAERPAPEPEALQRGTPKYATVIPAGKSIEQLGGWRRISPPEREPVYAYTDTLAGVPIAVSQQPLPKDFRGEPEVSVAELAEAYKATTKLPVGSLVVHVGTSAKGPQSLIFAKDNLLILIKSDAPVPSDNWSDYIGSLQ